MTKSSSAWQVPISESATFHPVKYSIANLPKNIKGLSKKRSTVVIEPTWEYYCQVGYGVSNLCTNVYKFTTSMFILYVLTKIVSIFRK